MNNIFKFIDIGVNIIFFIKWDIGKIFSECNKMYRVVSIILLVQNLHYLIKSLAILNIYNLNICEVTENISNSTFNREKSVLICS